MSSYRDTVRDMMNDIKTKGSSTTTSEAAGTNSVPNEEDLLDDILDLEEGAAPIDDAEAEQLLASSDVDEDGKTLNKDDENNDSKADSKTESDENKSSQPTPEPEPEQTESKQDESENNGNNSEPENGSEKVEEENEVENGSDKITEDIEKSEEASDKMEVDKNDEASEKEETESIENKEIENKDDDEEKEEKDENGASIDSDSKDTENKENDDSKSATEVIDEDDENSKSSSKNEVEEITSDNEVEAISKDDKKAPPRRDSDSSSIEMIEEFSRKKSVDEDDDNDEASSSSATGRAKRRGRGRPKGKRSKPKETEVVELSSNEDQDEENDQDEDSSDEESDDETGDPDKAPGEGCSKDIPNEYLQPFIHGWRREVVYRQKTKDTASQCDIYYIPPQDGRYRTREAKRKRRSKTDQERYFEDFPDDNLSLKHFNYVRKPLGLENAAYEIVRKSKLRDEFEEEEGEREKKSMKEVEESAGLLESAGEDDEEICMINGFDVDMPISLQALRHTAGMQSEFKQRKKYRNPETCCTPPIVEDQLWTNLDDDPFGVYTSLGGRSSPVTPPPLRAVRLTYPETVEKISKAFEDIKVEAFKHEPTKEVDLHEDMASHDYAIKKFKNYKSSLKEDPTWSPDPYRKHSRRDEESRGPARPRGRPGLASSLIMRPVIDRPCTPKCPGSFGILPSMQCVICKAMYHAKCQGLISPNLKVFKCKRCLNRRAPPQGRAQLPSASDGATVKLKLPMIPKNGKRPIVELVLRTPEGRYQPIKFRNNSQITETIPRSLFHKANTAKKILYVKSQQLPKLNGKPVFLAINPVNPIGAGASSQRPQAPIARQQPPNSADQVSILVRPQKSSANTRPVLLNVPRKVALKVKVGTTLSFSASNDQKYIVMDSKIHPAVGTRKGPSQQTYQQPSPSKRLPLPPSLSVMRSGSGVNRTLANLMNNKRPGLTITRGPTRPAKVGRPMAPLPSGSNVLASGEVVGGMGGNVAQPCTPYCPGVSGFPDLECTHCQSLFHSKCVGIHQSVLERIRSTFRCRICTPVQPRARSRAPAASGGSVTVIDLD